MDWATLLGVATVIGALWILITGLRALRAADAEAGGKTLRSGSDPAPYEPTSDHARLMRGINEAGDPIPMPPRKTSLREAWSKPDRPRG